MGSCTNNTSNINKTFIIESTPTNTGNTFVISGVLSGDTLSLLRNDTVVVDITGFTDFYTTGATLSNNTLYFNTNNALSAYTVNLDDIVFSGGSGSCVNDLFINELNSCSTSGITLNNDITPNQDNTINLGTPIKRFRDLNTFSGTSTVWSATTRMYTPNLDLGLDSLNNSRIITANNSVIQDDCLNGGNY